MKDSNKDCLEKEVTITRDTLAHILAEQTGIAIQTGEECDFDVKEMLLLITVLTSFCVTVMHEIFGDEKEDLEVKDND